MYFSSSPYSGSKKELVRTVKLSARLEMIILHSEKTFYVKQVLDCIVL